jgi:hypothetical protein
MDMERKEQAEWLAYCMERKEYEKWLAYYTNMLANRTDDAIQGYWYLYGRDSDSDKRTFREMAAWTATNYAMQERGL